MMRLVKRFAPGGLAVVVLLALVGTSLGTAAAIAPREVKVDILSNDYPEDPAEPDQRLKGEAKESFGGSMKWNLLVSHEGEKFELPKGENVPKWFKDVWLDSEITCVNFFEEDDRSAAAVAAVQVTDTGWIDPAIAGGFPQIFQDSWYVLKFVDGGPDGVGDWIRTGRADLDPSLVPPAPPFTEERALEFCVSGEVLDDGDEPCWGGLDNPTETVDIDGQTYGPWPDEQVCESWRTTDTVRIDEGGNGFLFEGDIRIK